MELPAYERRGYLNEPFRFFSLCDKDLPDIVFHYHEFHKIILLIEGNVIYTVEGRKYLLSPCDIIMIGRGCVHRPEVRPGQNYRRMILYISPEFTSSHSNIDCDLETCFNKASNDFGYAVSTDSRAGESILNLFYSLDRAYGSDEFGSHLMCRALTVQLLIELGRYTISHVSAVHQESGNEKIADILRYINSNLTSELTVDGISGTFFISKYHLMRSFKAETGYTMHSYITNKRLLLAHRMIADGSTITGACFSCGFHDYSAFSRAFKKLFGYPPGAIISGGQP